MEKIKRKTQTKRKLPFIKTLFVTMLATVALVAGGVSVAYADVGDVPEHGKFLKDNGDGTYTIALNVKGDSEKQIQKVNVIVIVDRSYSMTRTTGTGAYVPSNQNGTNMYGFIDGEYVPLTRQGNRPGNYTYWYNGVQYTGQRYQYDANSTRLEATQAAVNGLAYTLLSYNGRDGNPNDTVEMALVTFAGDASTEVSSTTSYDTYSAAVNSITNGNGTNWEEALKEADTVSFGDSDPTYVIFFTDGAPTYSSTRTGIEQEPNMQYCYEDAVDDAQALAAKVGVKNFYTIFAYGESFGATYLTSLTTAAGAPSENNYSASNTAELNDAFAAILESIEMAGIGSVGITDGTTSNVGTSAEPIELLEVVPNFKYYRAGGDYSDLANYDPENGQYGDEWTDIPDAAKAQFNDPTVTWNIPGVLENDVIYTVTFDCYPSQETLDDVADIKNDPGPDGAWADLDDETKKYIDQNGNLMTNTTATLSWTDTREENPTTHTAPIDNPGPVENSAIESLAVTKDWKNLLEDEWDKPTSVTLNVTRDNDPHYTVTLNDGNSWTDSVYISIGIMGADGKPLTGSEGHDFTFTEPQIQGESFKWEIDAPTVHPMLIDNVVTMLVKQDADHTPPAGAKTYQFNDATYYVDEAATSLTATNERRSSLNITKVVDGNDAPADTIFPFTLHVDDPLAPATAPSEADDPGHDSDYWIWISVRDKDGNRINEGVEGATSAGGGWWYAANDTDVTIPVKAGYSIRVNNLPVGTTYTITEGDLPTGYVFDSSALSFVDGDEEAEWAFTPGQKSTGSIDTTNAVFLATFTNTYELVDINVDKVWVDESNAYNSRPDTLTLTLNAPQGVTVPNPEIAKNGNTWTYTWKGLPKKDASGEEYEYTVSEDTVPAGYTKSPADAVEDGGTITNTYEPTAAKLELKAGKKLESPQGSNAPDVTGKYDLVLEAAKDVPMPANAAVAEDGTQTVTMKNKDGNGGMDSFGEISYTKPGVYQYKVSEEGTVKGVTNGTDSYTVTVTVADDGTGTGTLKATAKVGEKATNEVLFTNTYSVKPVKASIKVTKVLEGAELAGGAYSFTLTGDGDVNQTKTNADDGTVTFDEITYEAAGEYKYTIKEVIPDPKLDYITYDEDTANVTVNVKDNGEGELVAEVSIDKETFTNKYTATGKVDITASKEYNRDLAGGDFTFTLTGDGDVNQTKTNADDGTVTFEPIEYTLDDLKETTEVETTVSYKEVIVDDAITYVNVDDETDVLEALPEGAKLNEETRNYDVTTTEEVTTYKDEATFTYTMKEKAGDKDYITYDDHTVTVTVTVKNVGEGKLEATANYEGSTTFVNTYSASGSIELEGTKILEGRDLKEGQFTFQLLDSDGATVLGETTNDANGGFVFSDLDELSFTEASDGETYIFYVAEVNDNKKGYTYDTDKRKVTVKVTDKGDGSLSFEIGFAIDDEGVEGLVFINTFEPVPVEIDPPVVKIIKGNPPADAEFTYQMKAVDPTDAPMPEGAADGVITITKTGAGEYEFGWITYTAPGNFMYELSELNDGKENWVYDATKYFLAVVVSEDEDGNLVESHAVVDSNQNSVDKATFTNEYTEEPINPPTGDDLAKVVTPLGIVAAASGLLVLGLGVGRRMRKDR